MKKIIIFLGLILFVSTVVQAQDPNNQQDPNNKKKEKKEQKPIKGIGFKAGLNFANVTNAESINSSNQTGFMVGVFLAPPSKSIISSKTELIYSKQGYNYKTNTNSGNVNLNYLIIPQSMGINITRFVQLQVGFQMAFLLNASADSTTSSGGSNPYGAIMDYYNKFDYGLGAGIEIYPIRNLLIGVKYNVSFGDMYKTPEPGEPMPGFIPSVDAKNNVVQFFAGLRF